MSQFDPAQFLDSTTTEASTRLPPLPVGDYIASIDELKSNTWNSRDGTKSGYKFDVVLKIDPTTGPARDAKDVEWPPQMTVNDSIMLETTESGAIDYGVGKNGRLRMYRDATGLNVAGQGFSPRQLVGRQIKVNVIHNPAKDGSGEVYTNIGKMAKV